jgi:putative ABC transport system permease protein
MGRGVALALIGGAAGCALALVATRGLRSLLYGVSATDPLTFAGASLAFVAVALLASFAPARRATRVDPVQSLRGG